MNNNMNNDVQMPESLVIMQAQNSLRQLLQAFPLTISTWRLLIKDLLHEIDDSYMAQLANDQEEYQKQLAEANQANEPANKTTTKNGGNTTTKE